MDEREYESEESAAGILLPMKHSKLDENSAMALCHASRRRENNIMVFSRVDNFLHDSRIGHKVIEFGFRVNEFGS